MRRAPVSVSRAMQIADDRRGGEDQRDAARDHGCARVFTITYGVSFVCVQTDSLP